MRGHRDSSGFTLIETMVATAILVSAIAVLASLGAVALRTTIGSRDRTLAHVLALSQYDALSTQRPLPAPSPPQTLDVNTAGWFDLTDQHGRVVGTEPGSAGTVFVRRWRVAAWPGRAHVRQITVTAGRCRHGMATDGGCAMQDPVRVSGLCVEAP